MPSVCRTNLRKSFVQQGGKIVATQTYQEGDQDFSAQLTAIRASEPDVIFIPGYYTDVGNIAIQARKLGIKVPLLGGDGWDSAKLGEIGGDAINGCFYSNHYSHQDPNPRVQEFIKKYKERYKGTPDGLAALGYDAARIVCEAIGTRELTEGRRHRSRIGQDEGFRRRDGQDHDRQGSQCGEAGRHSGNEKRRADVRDDDQAGAGEHAADERTSSGNPRIDRSVAIPKSTLLVSLPSAHPLTCCFMADFVQTLMTTLAVGSSVCADRARLHDGVRHSEVHQLRA